MDNKANQNEIKEVDSSSSDTDGTFTHHKAEPHEVDSFSRGPNRFGEMNPRPVLGRQGDRSLNHFDGSEKNWSDDSRSEAHAGNMEERGNDDVFIEKQIKETIAAHSGFDFSHVFIKVTSGLVFITGHVSTQKEKEEVDRFMAEIYGITGVMNTLSVGEIRGNGLVKGLC